MKKHLNKNNEIILSYFQVGVIVRVNGSFLGEPFGVLGYVYECYDNPGITGVSVITENGVDLGGFSLNEQLQYLEQVGDTGIVYRFSNVIQLGIDFEKGIKPLFARFLAVDNDSVPGSFSLMPEESIMNRHNLPQPIKFSYRVNNYEPGGLIENSSYK